MRFRVTHLFALTAVIALVLIALEYIQVAVWIGNAPLEITLVEPLNRKIVAVATAPLMNRTEADALLQQPESRNFMFDAEAWKPGRSFTTHIQLTGRCSLYGRDLEYFQCAFIALRLQFDDGSVQYKTIEVPDLRKQRSITVTVKPRDSSQ